MKTVNNDFSKNPRSVSFKEQALYYLNSPKYRNDFINKYAFWGIDNHTEAYREWIDRKIQASFHRKLSNALIGDILQLSINLNYFNEELFQFSIRILKARFYEFTKLSSLEYIFFYLKNSCNKKELEGLLQDFEKSTKKASLQIQSLLNLSLINFAEYSHSIFILLKQHSYPTYFYRVANFCDYFNIDERNFICKELIILVEQKPFRSSVKDEIINKVSQSN